MTLHELTRVLRSVSHDIERFNTMALASDIRRQIEKLDASVDMLRSVHGVSSELTEHLQANVSALNRDYSLTIENDVEDWTTGKDSVCP